MEEGEERRIPINNLTFPDLMKCSDGFETFATDSTTTDPSTGHTLTILELKISMADS